MKNRTRILMFASALLILFSPPASKAGNMFLKLDGIDGESQEIDHEDEIDVLSWSWKMTNSSTTHMGGSGGTGRVSFEDLSLTKYLDKSSPKLMLKCSDGSHIATATLVVRKSGDRSLEYLVITMTNVIVTKVSIGGSDGENRLTENITLNFSEVEVEYIPQKIDGSADTPVLFGWDIAANTPN